MKFKPSGKNFSPSPDSEEFAEIIETLKSINRDTMISIDESHYFHLGALAEACVRHLESMKKIIQELESNNVDTRH